MYMYQLVCVPMVHVVHVCTCSMYAYIHVHVPIGTYIHVGSRVRAISGVSVHSTIKSLRCTYTCTYMYVHVCAHTCCHLYTRHASTHICAHFQWANHAPGEIILPSRITNRCSTHPTTLVLQPGPFQRRHQDCPATTDTLLCVGRRNQSH